jgi:hypothetical protein
MVSRSPSLIAMIERGKLSPLRKSAELLDVVLGVPGTFARLKKRLLDVPFRRRATRTHRTRTKNSDQSPPKPALPLA